MTQSGDEVSVGPWAKEKLDALGQYLNFYTTALSKHHWLTTIFVDAFAGPGLSVVRSKAKGRTLPQMFVAEVGDEEVEYLKGSPRVALDIARPFSSYVFIDSDIDRVTELKLLSDEYAGRRDIRVHRGDSNSVLQDWLASGIDWSKNKAVVFLDPFGMQVSWAIIEALAKTKAIEVLINFPFDMAINRMLVKSGEFPPGWKFSLDTFFGSADWQKIAYEESEDLFGKRTSKSAESTALILAWYRGRLKEAFGYVSTARLVKNTRGNSLYHLIWAGPHPLGLKGAEYILGPRTKS